MGLNNVAESRNDLSERVPTQVTEQSLQQQGFLVSK